MSSCCLVLGKSLTLGLNDTTITAEVECSIYFSRARRKFCLSLNYNGNSNFLFVNTTKIYQFKKKTSEINHIYCV